MFILQSEFDLPVKIAYGKLGKFLALHY